jgi:hypothetical protein
MGNKINIAELLKDCPKGMELDCALYNNVTLECVEVGNIEYPIEINIQSGEDTIELTEYGCWDYSDNAKCIIFPKGKTTWDGFVPPRKFRDGDIVSAIISSVGGTWIGIFKQYENGGTFETYCSLSTIGEFHNTNSKRHLVIGTHLATEEEKGELFKAIKENGYRWNAETKTLYKLPKFEDGDIVCTTLNSIVILKNESDEYYSSYCGIFGNDGFHIDITVSPMRLATKEEKQKLFDAIKKSNYKWNGEKKCLEKLKAAKFDINTLVQFEDKVLVRKEETDKWMPARWGFYDNLLEDHNYIVEGGNGFNMCIPYKWNEHLLGTANDCDNFYKTWEE